MNIDFYIDFGRLLAGVNDTMHNGLIHFLFGFIIFDIAFGTIKAMKFRKTSSSKGLAGLTKHALFMSLALFIDIYFPLFNLEWAATFILMYFVLYYAMSIVENTGELGFPWPPAVKRTLYKLNDVCDNALENKINVIIKDDCADEKSSGPE